MKKALFLFATTFLLITLSACSTEGTTTSNNGDVTELTVWLWDDTGLEKQFKQYDEENENIKLNLQLTSFEDIHTNLTTAIGAGTGAPDIAVVEGKELTKYFGNPEQFYNLYDLGAGEIEGEYLDWKFQQGIALDGKNLIALPLDIAPVTMAYNIDIFKEAGLPTDREEVGELIKTWDDYLEIGKKIKEKTGKKLVDSTEGLYYILESQLKQKYYGEDGKIIVPDNIELKNAYNYAVKVSNDSLSAGLDQFNTEWGTAIENNDFATVFMPSWARGIMEGQAPNAAGKWDMTSVPEGSGNRGGSYIVIPKQSEHPEEAFELLKWITSPEQQLVTFKQTGQFPSTPSVYDDDVILNMHSEYFNNAPIGKLYVDASETIVPITEGPLSMQIEVLLGDAIVRIEDTGIDPEDSWNQAIEEIERQSNR